MKTVDNILCTLLLSVPVVYTANADVLELKNKGILEGKYAGATSETIRFQVGAETKVVPLNEIVALTITGSGAGAASSGQSNPNTGFPGSAAGAATGAAAGQGAAATSGGAATSLAPTGASTIPAGTELPVKLDTGVDSSRDSAGTRFTGKLEKDVSVNGRVAIPAGSMVTGQVNQSQEAGRLRGQSSLGLTLTGITVNGQQLQLATENYALAGSNESKKTIRRAGGGAAIGAIAGGGEGAAKGAAIGGAASAGKGQPASVPAGSVVPFRLLQPLTIGSPTGR